MSFFKPQNTSTSQTDSKSSSNSPFIGVQAKLNIGKSNDKYEKEADAVADKVVNKKGLFGNEPFIAPSPTIQKTEEGEKDIQKSEETEQIQEKPIHDSITPLVQTKAEEELQQKEEESVQMMQEEEPVQAKNDEEVLQKSEEEEALQAKGDEEGEIQKKSESDESDVQTKTKESSTASDSGVIQRMDDEIQKKEEEIQEKEGEEDVQRSSSADTGDTSNLESNLARSKGGGSPMDSSTKGQMESGFGTDFGGVRIHNDANAVQMNKELGSQAFANGNDIYFNEGKYNPNSKEGQHLLAHELTHTVQQGASTQPAAQTKIQKAAAAPEPADAPATKPTTPLDISHKLDLTDAWSKFLDAQYAEGKRKFEVDVKIGTRYSGTIELSKKRGTAKGELAKYEITSGTKKNFLNISGWSFLQPMRDAGVDPVLVLNKFGDEQQTTGFLSVAVKGVAIGNAKGFITKLNENLDKMGFLGLKPIKVTDGFENKFEQGRLIFQVGAMTTVVDGFLEAGGGMGITGDTFTFNVNAEVEVAGLASGKLMLARGESGKLSGKLDIEAQIANVQAKLMVEYIEGAVTIQGTGKIESEKFSGEITLLVTDKVKSKQMMNAALGVESMDAEKKQAETPAAKPVVKSKNNQVLAGWGEVTANITPWLSGTAKVGIDSEGHVTIVGEITVPQDVELMEQRGKKVDLFKVEIRAGYGIPLVGQAFLFASIGMFMNAGFGPLVLKNVGFKGTYSTDPNILQQFEVTGTLNINAFAIIGLEAEAGVGITILGHDVKAGVNITAAAGLRAYAEATPTLEYKEQKSPQGGKMGETRLKGHFEAAAQLFLQLSGSLFYELDSPWWSPAPDGREDFPLGEVQYPIGDSMGIGADMDWLVGSPDIPELKFSPVEFDPDKFTADVMAEPPPGKKGKSDEKKGGKWEDKNKPGEKKDPPEKKDGKGLKGDGKKKEDLKKLPDQQKYMRSLDEMSKLEKASPKPTLAVVKAKAKKVKAKYGIDSITVKDKGNKAEISVKHKKENNKRNILKVPLMSAAERAKLLVAAMKDIDVRLTKAAGDDRQITEAETRTAAEAWKKKHPVIESFVVVDGGTTWDLKVDLGDKSGPVRGKTKLQDKKDGKESEKSDGNAKHKAIGKKIEAELKKPSEKGGGSFDKLYAEKTSLAKKLEKKYQKELEKGIKLSISFGSLSEEKKDNDIDFSIIISPNDYSLKFAISDTTSLELADMEIEGTSRPVVQVFQKKFGKLKPLSPKADQGYLGQVISTPDPNLSNYPRRYNTEAFSKPDDASKRFSLVLGVNKFDDFGGVNKGEIAKMKDKFSDPGYPLGIIGLLWTPNWKVIENGKKKKITKKNLVQKVDSIKDKDKQKEIISNIEKAESGVVKKPGTKHIPYGKLRDKINNHAYTSAFSSNLRKNVNDVYIHLADTDSITMKVSGANSIDINEIFGGMDKPLFDVYDAIIKQSNASGKPAIVSGGYRFTVDVNIDDGDQLRALANLIDQEFRQAVAKVDPTILYLPEPNTIVKLAGDKLEVSFGVGRNESKAMMKNLLKQRPDLSKSKDEIEFMVGAGLTTNSKRFNAKLEDGTPMKGQITTYELLANSQQGEINRDEFISLFRANQMQASELRVGAEIAGSENYLDPSVSKSGRKKFESTIRKLYRQTSPMNLVETRGDAWPTNIVKLLKSFNPSAARSNVIAELVSFYTRRNMFTPADRTAKATKVAEILIEGSKSVKKSMQKIFKTAKPV